MGRYFGREPRYSRQEIEAQAQQAIEARVSLGRPPDEDWQPLNARLAEIDREIATRPRLESFPSAPRPGKNGNGNGNGNGHGAAKPADEPLEVTQVRRAAATGTPAAARKRAGGN